MERKNIEAGMRSLAQKNRYIKSLKPLNEYTFRKEADKVWRILRAKEPFFNIKEPPLLKDIYKQGLLYFRGDGTGSYKLDKGLFCYGSPGSGKSLFFDVFKEYLEEYNVNSFKSILQLKIISSVHKNGIDALSDFVGTEQKPIILYIDDFLAGNTTLNHYGTTFNVIDELIQQRYELFKKTGALTHFSSNISPKNLSNSLDARVVSRMNEMCNIIFFGNKDNRK